jgi:hypothetical protein
MKLFRLQLREDTFQNHRKGVCEYMRDTRYVCILRRTFTFTFLLFAVNAIVALLLLLLPG